MICDLCEAETDSFKITPTSYFLFAISLNISTFHTHSQTAEDIRCSRFVLLSVLVLADLVVFGINFKTNSKLKALPAAPQHAVNVSLGNRLKAVLSGQIVWTF